MKEQLSNTIDETMKARWNHGLDIFIESVYKPDSDLRGFAHDQDCYNELMWIREHVLEYLQTLRR